MLLGIIVKICKICRAEESKNLIFDYWFVNFFPHLQNFLKIGIDTHPIDLSCHQKFEKNSLTGIEAKILVHEVGKYEKVTVD